MIDKTLILRKIKLIGEDLKRLKPLSFLSFRDYKKDYRNEILAERYLERIIGRLIDINYHLIVEIQKLPPKDYFESFIFLGRLKIISLKLAKKLAKSAGLRNRLAHEYNGIDERLVHQAIKNCFHDLPKYLKQTNNFLERN